MRASARPARLWSRRRRTFAGAAVIALAVGGVLSLAGSAAAEDGGTSDAPILGIWEVQSLSGANNNPFFPNLGKAGTNYLRLAPSRYADGRSQPVSGPNTRNVSNRIFNDGNQNLFSERAVSQWGNVWGQFLDHTFGLREENGTTANIPFNQNDPMESFTNTLGVVPFVRTKAAPNTGVFNVRQHVNTENAFIDAEVVYGSTDVRLDWMRNGSVDGNPDNNSATMLMPSNYLPRKDSRGSPSTAPNMAVDGRLLATPNKAVVAGDVRANENIALTATHTLFAREHNRIVSLLPSWVSQQDKFQIARAVVIAEQQYITYNEFLPAMGVTLPSYQGYNANLNPANAHEFATVGYRAHSMIHGGIEVDTNVSRYSSTARAALEAQGIELEIDGTDVEFEVPLNVAFFNPDLVPLIQLGPLLQGIGSESEYKNDEQIDNQLRSVLFQVPVTGNPECLDGPTLPECFRGVVDLGAIDIERGRDHGMPTYNQLRNAYGLPSKTSFTAITGEATESFPSSPVLTPGNEINDPNSLDVLQLFDIDGNPIALGSPEAESSATREVRRTTVAARLKAIYGSVNNLDAFTGMVAERHLTGVEFGELQRAIWREQFTAFRDGDRFFYLNDPLQPFILQNFGINFRKTLAQVIAANTDIPLGDLAANVFRVPAEAELAGASSLSASGSVQPDIPSITSSNLTRHQGGANGTAVEPKGGKVATVPGGAGARAVGRAMSRRPKVKKSTKR